MSVRAIYVATLSDAERQAWPELEPFCGQVQRGRSSASSDSFYYVYADDEQERDVLRRWIAELRLGDGWPAHSVTPCPYQAPDGMWIPRAHVYRRIDGRLSQTEVCADEGVGTDSQASAIALSMQLGRAAFERPAG